MLLATAVALVVEVGIGTMGVLVTPHRLRHHKEIMAVRVNPPA
jgi:hypothetical protein